MASSREYLNYVLEQLSDLEEIDYKYMMGEYILYYRGKMMGGICDNRLLVKQTKAAAQLMPTAHTELPYDGAKPMILVEEVDSKAFLRDLFEAMWEELPVPKRKK